MIGASAPTEMYLFSRDFEKKVSFLYGDCDQIFSLQGENESVGALMVHFPTGGMFLNISCLFQVC